MSFSLPGTDLYYLPRDDLAPERYEEITSPVFAWPKVDSKYVFDDRMHFGFKLINIMIISSSSVRGKYDLIHIFSEKTNSTVSLRVLSESKYDFDTLTPERSSKF